MKCYVHPDREAVGVCTVCKQGICRDCQVILGGKRFCKKHAERRLVSEDRAEGLRKRGWALTIASILAVTGGLSGVVVGFLLVIIGLLGPGAQNSSMLATTVGPLLNYFSAVTQYPSDQTILVGLATFLFGSMGIGAAYFLWRRSKRAAILSIILAVIGEVLVGTYLELLALAGAFTFVWVADAIVRVVLIGLGWKHLR